MIRRQLFLSAECRPNTIDGTNYTKSADTGTYVSGIIDTQGYDSVAIITQLGAVTGGAVVTQTLQDGNNSGMSDSSNLILPNTSTGSAGTGTTAQQQFTSPASDSAILWDVYQPQKRYLTVTTVIGTANAAVLSQTIILFNAKQSPVTQGSLVAGYMELNSPADALTV